jgi:hypothetical protein
VDHQAVKRLSKIGWILIIPISLMGVGGALGHILDQFMRTGNHPAIRETNILLFGLDFFNHWLGFRRYETSRGFHMIPGTIFMMLAPFQFMPASGAAGHAGTAGRARSRCPACWR